MDLWTHLYTNHPVVLSTSFYTLTTILIAFYGIAKQRQTSREKNALDFEDQIYRRYLHSNSTKLSILLL